MGRLTNAKQEFLQHIGDRTVKCATIGEDDCDWRRDEGTKPNHAILPVNYSQEQYDAFLAQLDIGYDSGYGGQNLYGNIWYTDGTWSERGEYDGSEWWEHREVPAIPEELAATYDNGPETILIN